MNRDDVAARLYGLWNSQLNAGIQQAAEFLRLGKNKPALRELDHVITRLDAEADKMRRLRDAIKREDYAAAYTITQEG
jgi:ABC-type uncharacterized transport system fused permease/ATPase subunit